MTHDTNSETQQDNTDIIDLDDDDTPAFVWPTVIAIVVSHNPGDWLEQCLSSLKLQEYPDLTTLVVDVCSDEDLSSRVAKISPSAFVRRSESNNFAQAVNEAIYSIEGATYVLICHDDIVLGSGAIAELVEEAFRSNASIVGPKIIDAAHPDHLLEVGGMIDRFGVPFRGIEPDEVDQGQHDGVRDVFFVSSATMLVRADLFRALGGFDQECYPGAEDIDIAWRAHLVGARVLVQPDAVVKHHLASDRQRKSRVSTTAIVARHRMRAVLKNASLLSLLWILPLAFILHAIEAIAWILRANPKRAWLLFSGWIWNIRHYSGTRKQRALVQKTREVSDRTIATYQIGGSARVRRFFTSILHNRQLKKITRASRTFATARYDNRTRETPLYLSAIFLYLIAVRSLLRNEITTIGEFVPWPSLKVQFSALLHGGLPVSKEPILSPTFGRIIAMSMTVLTGGNPAIARSIFLILLIPLGSFGVRLLLRERKIDSFSIAIAAITYGIFTLGIHSFSSGDFGSIVMLAALPYYVRALHNYRYRQIGISAAVMVAFFPSAILVCVIIAVVFVVVGGGNFQNCSHHGRQSEISERPGVRKRITVVLGGGLIALIINCGMLVDALRGVDRSTFGFTHSIYSFSEYFADQRMTAIATWVSIAIAICAVIVGRNERTIDIRILILSAMLLSLIAYTFIYFVQPIFEVSALYAVIQLIVALSIGVSLHAYKDELTIRSFGIWHLFTLLSIAAVALSIVSSIPIIGSGTLGLPTRSWVDQLEIRENEQILYLGDSRTLIGRDVIVPYGRSISPTLDEPSIASSFVGPSSMYEDQIRAVYSVIMDHSTSHGGYLFAQLGIGTIAVPTSRAPGGSEIKRDTVLLDALNRQSDLVRLKDREGMVVYTNTRFNKGIDPLRRPIVGPPFDELSNYNLQNIIRTEKVPIGISAPITIILCLSSCILVILWKRRHNLINPLSKSTSSVNTTSLANETIDLIDEHNIDAQQENMNEEHVEKRDKQQQDV